MFKSFRSFLVFISSFFLIGCATESERTVRNLDSSSLTFNSQNCQKSVRDIDFHSDLKKAKTLAVPLSIIISGGFLLIPSIVASAGLSALDRIDASNISSRCGGKKTDKKTIKKNVVTETLIDSVTILPIF